MECAKKIVPDCSDEFYPNDKTCKECRKALVRQNRAKNAEYYREYDKERGNRQTPEYLREWRDKNPEKYKAHSMVNYHLRAGNLTKKACEICGSSDRIHGHHDDYNKPLDVRWLCPEHHAEFHPRF